MKKYEELSLKILEKLREIFTEEYYDAEGNLIEEKNCKPFFEGCLIASGILYNDMTESDIGPVEFAHIYKTVAVDLVKKYLKEMGEEECLESES